MTKPLYACANRCMPLYKADVLRTEGLCPRCGDPYRRMPSWRPEDEEAARGASEALLRAEAETQDDRRRSAEDMALAAADRLINAEPKPSLWRRFLGWWFA